MVVVRIVETDIVAVVGIVGVVVHMVVADTFAVGLVVVVHASFHLVVA